MSIPHLGACLYAHGTPDNFYATPFGRRLLLVTICYFVQNAENDPEGLSKVLSIIECGDEDVGIDSEGTEAIRLMTKREMVLACWRWDQ